MRILQINAVSGIRSTGRICVEIADYLNDNGAEGYIAYSEGIPYEKGYKIGTALEKRLHALFSRVFGLQAHFSRFGTKHLLKYIDNLKPDVVHLHNLHSNYINLKLLANYLAKNDIPTVITLHDCWFYTGKCTHYTVDNCYKWKTCCKDCPRLRNDNPSWFFDCTKKMYNDKRKILNEIRRLAIVGVSDWITNEAKKSYFTSDKIITNIYNWIDSNVFQPINVDDIKYKLKLKSKFIIVGVASEWSNAKGLDKFIELSKMLQDDMTIVLVGNININTKLPDNILNIKETHNVEELISYYSMANVLINMSFEESFGKVSAEALACGTPIIVFDSTANPELVGDGCGYVVEKNDMTGIRNAIFEVHKNGKENYSKKCIEFANTRFNKNERINNYVELYQKLLDNS